MSLTADIGYRFVLIVRSKAAIMLDDRRFTGSKELGNLPSWQTFGDEPGSARVTEGVSTHTSK